MHTFYIVIINHLDTNNPYARKGDDGNFSGVAATPSLFYNEHEAEKIINQYNYRCEKIGGKICKAHIQEVKINPKIN